MKKAVIMAVVFAFVLGLAAPVLADVPGAIEKFANGTVEVITSPVEIYHHTKSDIDEHKAIGLFTGLITSPFHVVKKAGGGLVDMLTFPIE